MIDMTWNQFNRFKRGLLIWRHGAKSNERRHGIGTVRERIKGEQQNARNYLTNSTIRNTKGGLIGNETGGTERKTAEFEIGT